MKELVDGVGQPITLGDTLIHKGKHSWCFGIITGISLRYGEYSIRVIMARKYYSADEYYYSTVGLISSNHIYKTTDIPDKIKGVLMRKVMM